MNTETGNLIKIEDILFAYDDDKESEICRYCTANNLNVADAGDYAQAAVEVLDYMPPVSYEEAMTAVQVANALALESNFSFSEKLFVKDGNEYNSECECPDINNATGEYGLLGSKCPKGTVKIAPSFLLRNAHYANKRIKSFKEDCYGMTEYAAYYAMNKLVNCIGLKKGTQFCAQKYLDFRKEGLEEFRRKVSK